MSPVLETHQRLIQLGPQAEVDCARHDLAKKKLNDDRHRNAFGHAGSYLFCQMGYGWHAVFQVVPRSMMYSISDLRFCPCRSNGDMGGLGPWRPIAREMYYSDTLIIKILGAFILEDKESFIEASYALADQNPDAAPLGRADRNVLQVGVR